MRTITELNKICLLYDKRIVVSHSLGYSVLAGIVQDDK